MEPQAEFVPGLMLARAAAFSWPGRLEEEFPAAAVLVPALANDKEASSHSDRMCRLVVAVGKALTLGESDIRGLWLGAALHDVGKICIPGSILRKAGPLAAEERAILNEHPALGERLCAPYRALKAALPIIRHHHERFDGSGYPDRLAGEAIPLAARIVQIVDIFDALITARCYKPAWPIGQALAGMRAECDEGHIDARLLREFARLIG
ncbi:MAG: HD domain-containing protein [Acidobacteria bacterium]|nr:HD domain-containing protein [Acidobacteriota bacterium]